MKIKLQLVAFLENFLFITLVIRYVKIAVKIPLIATCLIGLLLNTSLTYGADLITAENTNKILKIAQNFGMARLNEDKSVYKSGYDPIHDGILKILGRINGNSYGIMFYGCSRMGQKCDNIKFAAHFSGIITSIEDIKRWNKTQKYAGASLDRNGELTLGFTINIADGMTEKKLKYAFSMWLKTLKSIKKEVLKIRFDYK